MISRSCLHNNNSLFYLNRIEASGPVFNSSCPILLFQNEMAHTGYWLRDFITFFFHTGPQFRSAVIRPWALASKLPFKYYSCYSERLGLGLIQRDDLVGDMVLGRGLRAAFLNFIFSSPNGWLMLLDLCLGVWSFISTLLSLSYSLIL